MNMLQELNKCQLCGKSGEDLSLYRVNHKELGYIETCRDCWTKLYTENRLVAGSGKKSCEGCSCCSC